MALVVFLRAVNVGGSKRFKPSSLADTLADLEVTSIGAAGTYVVHGDLDPETVRTRTLEALPFETDVMIRPGARIQALIEEDPLGTGDLPEGTKAYMTVLAQAPEEVPDLPEDRPPGAGWQFRLVAVREADALCLRRPDQPGRYYPNAVVEDLLGVPATTRGWATVERIGRLLQENA